MKFTPKSKIYKDSEKEAAWLTGKTTKVQQCGDILHLFVKDPPGQCRKFHILWNKM